MPGFHLSWKGSPHHRPRIQVASASNPQLVSPARAHRAAEAVAQKPLSDSLQKLRRAQRALVRRKRRSKVRVSFAHSTSSKSSSAGKRKFARRVSGPKHAASLHHSTEPAAWRDIEAPVARPATRRGFIRRYRSSPSQRDAHCLGGSPSKPRFGSPRSLARGGQRRVITPPTAIFPHRATIPESPRLSNGKPTACQASEQLQEERDRLGVAGHTTHSRPPYTRTADPHQGRQFTKKGASISQARGIRPARPRYTTMPNPNYPRIPAGLMQVRLHLGDPVALESVRRSLSQQNRLSHLVPLPPESQASGSSVSHTRKIRLTSLAPTPEDDEIFFQDMQAPSRSSSRRQELDRFARQLEKFALITNSQGRPPLLTPTVSPTPNSLNTIQELLPYREEFQAAGLAVTSDDQKSPRKTVVGERAQFGLALDGDAKSLGSGECSSSAKESSDDTMIHFREQDPLTLALADKLPQKSKRKGASRKILPWLRKKESCTALPEATATALAATRKSASPPSTAQHLKEKPLPWRPCSPQRSGGSPRLQSKHDPACPKGPNGPLRRQAGSTMRGHAAKLVGARDRPLPPPPQREAPRSSLMEWPFSCGPSPDAPQMERVVWIEREDKRLPSLPAAATTQFISTPTKVSRNARRGRPITIQEETEPSPEKEKTPIRLVRHSAEDEAEKSAQHKENEQDQMAGSPSLELPETWRYAVTTPSSFEKALDEVVRKLDDMEERDSTPTDKKREPRTKRLSSKATPAEKLQHAVELRRQRLSGQTNGLANEGPPAPALAQRKASPPGVGDITVDHEDRDINDRDVLKGLKVAISAACDEDLDAWIRSRTGLRLRRFLADLKTFENLKQEDILGTDETPRRQEAGGRKEIIP